MRYDLSLILGTSIFLLGLYLLSALNALSYIDPGSGSYVLQILIASVLGILTLIKIYWSKLKAFFVSYLIKKPDNESTK
jgi:membrane-anchored glycerophosphoryl diester phosphodiesterase (GDPDase)